MADGPCWWFRRAPGLPDISRARVHSAWLVGPGRPARGTHEGT
jgi:hypothetical protein